MSLNSIEWEPMYSSDDGSIIRDFYKPAILNSTTYKRITGYFSAEFLNILADEIKSSTLNNKIKISILCSPNMKSEDKEKIAKGYKIRDLMEKQIITEIENFSEDNDAIPFVTKLIAENTLDIKFVYLKNKSGLFHDKKGVFIDKDNYKIAFTGSNNETYSAIYNNYESLTVLTQSDNYKHVEVIENNFDLIWNNELNELEVLNVSDKIIEKLKQKSNRIKENTEIDSFTKINIASVYNLHDYQEEAVEKWKENNFKGLLEMATGTGKTITSLACNQKLADTTKKLVTVIVVPQIELLYQWEKDLLDGGTTGIICSSDNKHWERKLNSKLRMLKRKKTGYLTAIVTRDTFIGKKFQDLISNSNDFSTLLIADEVHSFGSTTTRNIYDNLMEKFPYRLGVSATPFRKSDSESKQLISFFDKVVFSYSLKEAIRNGFLNEYVYKPVLLYFDQETLYEYRKSVNNNLELIKKNDAIAIQTIERLTSSIANSSTAKVEELINHIDNNGKDKQSIIYCAPGVYNDGQNKFDQKHIEYTANKLSEEELSFRIIRSGVESEDRKKILSQFKEKQLNSLLAIKCLDQGINLPEVAIAYILSSTDSETEFIQRRGRILRTFEGKPTSVIYDFVMLPQDFRSLLFSPEEADGYFVSRELRRMKSYNSAASNNNENRELIEDIEEAYKEVIEMEDNENA
ncbi:DEAD/DEAH box helicase family protein [Alkalibacterium putridalgicola]|uniref:DEAD/DEAH box helicase family protein n=1 Tax=Alkalibacterium putridalgicola TaxID=426703 RepID=UPI0034CD3AD4